MPRDSFSTHSATNSNTTPKVCATVAPPWSVVTRPDRSRSGSSAPPAHIAVPTASWTGVWWKWAKCCTASEPASQAAAPAQPAACVAQRLGRAGQRLPALSRQVAGQRGQLVPVGGRVGAGQPLVALLQAEPALGDGRAQDLGDLFALGVRGADPAGAG